MACTELLLRSLLPTISLSWTCTSSCERVMSMALSSVSFASWLSNFSRTFGEFVATTMRSRTISSLFGYFTSSFSSVTKCSKVSPSPCVFSWKRYLAYMGLEFVCEVCGIHIVVRFEFLCIFIHPCVINVPSFLPDS